MVSDTSDYERRRFPRVELSMLVQFRVENYEQFLKEYAVDISLGGMFVRTENPRAKGDMIYFQFAVSSGRKIIEGLGRVVHVNPPGGEAVAGMGIEFVNVEEDSLAVIEQIVEDRLSS